MSFTVEVRRSVGEERYRVIATGTWEPGYPPRFREGANDVPLVVIEQLAFWHPAADKTSGTINTPVGDVNYQTAFFEPDLSFENRDEEDWLVENGVPRGNALY